MYCYFGQQHEHIGLTVLSQKEMSLSKFKTDMYLKKPPNTFFNFTFKFKLLYSTTVFEVF